MTGAEIKMALALGKMAFELGQQAVEAYNRKTEILQDTVKDVGRSIEALAKSESLRILDHIERNKYEAALLDVKAKVFILEDLIGESDIERSLNDRLVQQSIVPLREAIIKAQHVLANIPDPQFSLCCEIVGLRAVVAGYEYLGQDASKFRGQLKDRMLLLQHRMLDQYAKELLNRGDPFPWNEVPKLLSTDGSLDLADMYIAVVPESHSNIRKCANCDTPVPSHIHPNYVPHCKNCGRLVS